MRKLQKLIEQTAAADGAAASSLETMLKAKYPNLAYHVADLSSSLWRTRNDYPHELIFQQRGDIAKKLQNWQPSGPNPQYSWFRGPLASKAVVVHPDAQKRMETDPEFAKEVMARIEAWWALDNARNEALSPGWTATMSQGVVIGKDGSIVNAVSGGGGGGGRITQSGSEVDWWDMRSKRHKEYMKLRQERQIEHQTMLSAQLGAQDARSTLLNMLNDNTLRTLGATISEALLAVWALGALGVIGWAALGHIRFLRYVRRWSAGAGERETRVCGELKELLGLRCAPRLLTCQGLQTPMLAGLLRPCLLLPEESMEETPLRHALLHELTHYKRRDILFKLLVLWVCALHWFNPAVWLMRCAVERDLELACDDAALRVLPESERAAYGQTILSAAERRQQA